MADALKVGDVVVWRKVTDAFDWTQFLGTGPFVIIASKSSERPSYHVVNADGSPLLDDEVASGPKRRRYYLVAEHEVRKDEFLTNVLTALALPTTDNRSDKEKEQNAS